jgi:hypothetical protein
MGCLYSTGYYAQDGTDDDFGSGSSITLENSTFTSYMYHPGLNHNSTTLIDLNTTSLYNEGPVGTYSNAPVTPSFTMNNCNICNYSNPIDGYSSNPNSIVGETGYIGYKGIVEIKLFKWQINITNNTINGYLPTSPTNSHNVNLLCFGDKVSSTASPNNILSNLNINNNKIYTKCIANGSLGAKFLGASVYSQCFNINNNTFYYHGTNVTPDCTKAFLEVDARGGNNSAYGNIARGLISDNLFIPKPTTYMTTGIIFPNTGTSNIFVNNNSFSSYNGSNLSIGPNINDKDWFNPNYSNYWYYDSNTISNNKGVINSIKLKGYLGKLVDDDAGSDYELIFENLLGEAYPDFIRYGSSDNDSINLQNIPRGQALSLAYLFEISNLIHNKIKPISFSISWSSTVSIPVNLVTMELIDYRQSPHEVLISTTSSLSGNATSLTRTYTVDNSTDTFYDKLYLRLSISGTASGSGTYDLDLSSITITYIE